MSQKLKKTQKTPKRKRKKMKKMKKKKKQRWRDQKHHKHQNLSIIPRHCPPLFLVKSHTPPVSESGNFTRDIFRHQMPLSRKICTTATPIISPLELSGQDTKISSKIIQNRTSYDTLWDSPNTLLSYFCISPNASADSSISTYFFYKIIPCSFTKAKLEARCTTRRQNL